MKKKQTAIEVLNECKATLTNVAERLKAKKVTAPEAKTILKDVKAANKRLVGTVHPTELSRLNAMIDLVVVMVKETEMEAKRKKLKG